MPALDRGQQWPQTDYRGAAFNFLRRLRTDGLLAAASNDFDDSSRRTPSSSSESERSSVGAQRRAVAIMPVKGRIGLDIMN